MNKLLKYINNNFRVIEFLLFVVMVFLMLLNLYLDPIHKKNIQKHNTHITNLWESEKKGQEYTLQHGDWVFFWKPDEKPVRVGMVYVLWGYYRIIAHKDGMTEFRDVEWCNANF